MQVTIRSRGPRKPGSSRVVNPGGPWYHQEMRILLPIALLAAAVPAHAGPVIGFSAGSMSQVPGDFRAIAAGEGTYALLRVDGTLLIPPGIHGAQNVPPGMYTAASCGGENDDHEWVVAIRTDGTLAGAGYSFAGTLAFPPGQFVAVSAGARFGVAMRADGTLAGWGNIGPGAPPLRGRAVFRRVTGNEPSPCFGVALPKDGWSEEIWHCFAPPSELRGNRRFGSGSFFSRTSEKHHIGLIGC